MKTSITIIILFLSNSIYAQFPAGSLLIKGSGSYSSANSETDFTNSSTSTTGSRSFRLSPSVKYFIESNSAIIGGVNYNSNFSESSSGNSGAESKTKSIGIFGGYQKFNFITEKAAISYAITADVSFPIDSEEFSTRSLNYGLDIANIGILYRVNDKLAIEGSGNIASLNFNTSKREGVSSSFKSNSFGFGFGLPVFGVGFLYALK